MRRHYLLLVAATVSAVAAAENFRQQGAHTHGSATLNIVVDGSRLLIELQTPAANVLGFEHAPDSAAQRQAAAETKTALRHPAGLFRLPPGAGCEVVDSELVWSVEQDAAGTGSEHEHEHEHGTETEHEYKTVHSEFHAAYLFDCAAVAELDRIELRLFERFPALQRIDARLAGEGGQRALTLSPAAPRLSF